MQFFGPLLKTAWTYSQQYTSSGTDGGRLGKDKLDDCNLRVAALMCVSSVMLAWCTSQKATFVLPV